jgi:hypothetical protein
MKSLTRFRLSTLLTLILLIAIGLGWYLDHRQQRRNTANAFELVRREAPWVVVEESKLPDWHESALGPDKFRFTVRRLVDESDQIVVLLTIETLQPQWHSLWSRGTTWFGHSRGGASSGTIDQRHRPDGYFTGSDTLTASQISVRDQQLARMSLGGGATTMEVPLNTPLNRVLEITAKDGIYSLHDPIVIGNAFGVEVKLAVGDRAKVDALAETPTQPSTATGESNDE